MKDQSSASCRTDPLTREIEARSGQSLWLAGSKAKTTVEGHTLVAESLKKLGVTHVYGLSGTPIRETFAYCSKAGMRSIGVRHQQAAVLMATAQNYVTGRLSAVALLSAGPAVTNAATGILVARDNCWPVVVLGGRPPLSMRGMGSFQELDAVSLYQSITKWSALVESASSIPETLQRAFRIALSGRPGPVYLDLPADVLTEMVSSYEMPSLSISKALPPDNAAVLRAVEILYRADRPAVIVGKGIRWCDAYEELARFIDTFGIPFITSPMARGFMPDDHPLCCNAVRGLLQSKADAVLLVGARLDWTFRFGSEFAPGIRIIQIDIDEQQIGVNVAPTVGILGDAKEVLSKLIGGLISRNIGDHRDRLASWHALLTEARAKKHRNLNSLMASDALPMSPYRMLKEIVDFLPRDAICILDGNVFMAAAQQVLPSFTPAARFTAGTNGCMGVGIPFGIGAKLSRPERPVMVITGDTAFAFNAMEMETAVRHRVPVLIVVVNNEGNCGALIQKALYPPDCERVTMFQPDIRYESIMRAFGGHGEFVGRPEELKPALQRSLQSGLPACINVKVDPNAPYPHE